MTEFVSLESQQVVNGRNHDSCVIRESQTVDCLELLIDPIQLWLHSSPVQYLLEFLLFRHVLDRCGE